MKNIKRREFTTGMLGSLLTLSFVEAICSNNLIAAPVRVATNKWLAEVEEASHAMKTQHCSQADWQNKIAEIFSRVEQKDLLRAIDFDRLSKKLKLVGTHEGVIETTPKRLAGMPEELAFSCFIYGMTKRASIPPHCHRNMTSMHMPIGGTLHGWHFDRISDEKDHVITKPTLDKTLAIGEVTTISDEKDNVHWFQAESEVAYTFNIGVYEVNAADKFTGRQFYLDAAHGEKTDGDKLRVRKLSSQEAYRIYGS